MKTIRKIITIASLCFLTGCSQELTKETLKPQTRHVNKVTHEVVINESHGSSMFNDIAPSHYSIKDKLNYFDYDVKTYVYSNNELLEIIHSDTTSKPFQKISLDTAYAIEFEQNGYKTVFSDDTYFYFNSEALAGKKDSKLSLSTINNYIVENKYDINQKITKPKTPNYTSNIKVIYHYDYWVEKKVKDEDGNTSTSSSLESNSKVYYFETDNKGNIE